MMGGGASPPSHKHTHTEHCLVLVLSYLTRFGHQSKSQNVPSHSPMIGTPRKLPPCVSNRDHFSERTFHNNTPF